MLAIKSRTSISENDELLIELVNESLEGICGIKADNEKVAQFIKQNEERFLILENQIPNVITREREKTGVSKKASRYERSGYTGKRIISFTFNNQVYYVDSWIKFLIKFSEIIYTEQKDTFYKVETLRGRKRKYYSTNKNEVVQPSKIGNSGYYVDTNLSANAIVKLIHNVMNLFGYKKDSLKINCSN
jgi:negative regulator of replication initiation